MGQVGLKVPAGEKGRMLIEQVSTRPTCDVNGIVGGYTGEGAKTVIAAQASAKISFRLVGKQDPEKIRASFRAYRARAPAGRRDREPSSDHAGSPALAVAYDNPALGKARAALTEEWGTEGGRGRLRRLDPDRRRLQERARHGHAAGRLRPR